MMYPRRELDLIVILQNKIIDNAIEYPKCHLNEINIPRGPQGISVIQLIEEELSLAGRR